MKYMQKLVYHLKNKKGASSIEIILGLLMMLMMFCFLMDLLTLLWKFSVVAQTNTYVARIAGIQGGALWSAPHDYPGGYETIQDIHTMVNDKLQSAGIASNEWAGSVGDGSIGRDGIFSSGEYDYKESFSVVLQVDYRWNFISAIIPGQITHTLTSRRPAMSEWKYNYDDWDGE